MVMTLSFTPGLGSAITTSQDDWLLQQHTITPSHPHTACDVLYVPQVLSILPQNGLRILQPKENKATCTHTLSMYKVLGINWSAQWWALFGESYLTGNGDLLCL